MLLQFPSRLMWVACVAALSAWCGPSVEAAPAAPGVSEFDRAAAAARSGRLDEALDSLEKSFAAGYPAPSSVLSRAEFRSLRDDAPRRARLNRLLRNHARESRVTIVPPGEAGVPLRFVARVRDARTGAAVPRAYVYVYQTDHTGYYDRDPGGPERGPENARVFGIARADGQGRVEINTIVPGSYPGGGFRHIHYFIRADGYEDTMREVILDEEPRPSRQQKEWAVRNGDVVARRSMGRASTLDVVLPVRRKG